jgi:hypothetical protein
MTSTGFMVVRSSDILRPLLHHAERRHRKCRGGGTDLRDRDQSSMKVEIEFDIRTYPQGYQDQRHPDGQLKTIGEPFRRDWNYKFSHWSGFSFA